MLVRFSLGMQQTGGDGQADDRAAAQGRRISVADDVAGVRLRHRLPAAGDPDAARPHRHHHVADSCKAKRRYFIVGAFIDRGGADAARHASASSRSRSRCCCSTRARSGRCRWSRRRRAAKAARSRRGATPPTASRPSRLGAIHRVCGYECVSRGLVPIPLMRGSVPHCADVWTSVRRMTRSDRPPCTTSNGFATTPTPSTARWRGAGLPAEAEAADRARRDAPRGDQQGSRRRRRAATRPRRRSARPRRRRTRPRAQKLMAEVAALKERSPALEAEEKAARARNSTTALAQIPNLPLDDVPDGTDEHGNVEHHHVRRQARTTRSRPKQHFELGEALGQMDFETAAKLSGARFVVLKKGLARLERALGQFMLDVHTERARLHRGQSAAAWCATT